MSGAKVACLVVGLGGVVAVGVVVAIVALIWNVFSEPRDAGHAFIADIRAGNYDAAYKKSATELRDNITLDEWDRLRDDELMTEIRESDDATFMNVNIRNNRGCLSGRLSPRGGAINLTILREDDTWRVAGVSRESCRP